MSYQILTTGSIYVIENVLEPEYRQHWPAAVLSSRIRILSISKLQGRLMCWIQTQYIQIAIFVRRDIRNEYQVFLLPQIRQTSSKSHKYKLNTNGVVIILWWMVRYMVKKYSFTMLNDKSANTALSGAEFHLTGSSAGFDGQKSGISGHLMMCG